MMIKEKGTDLQEAKFIVNPLRKVEDNINVKDDMITCLFLVYNLLTKLLHSFRKSQ